MKCDWHCVAPPSRVDNTCSPFLSLPSGIGLDEELTQMASKYLLKLDACPNVLRFPTFV